MTGGDAGSGFSKERFFELAKGGVASYVAASKRTAKDKLYTTLEDFSRTDAQKKRLIVIGCTGSGKSTLLNVVGGWRYVQSKETDYQFIWQKKAKRKAAAKKPSGGGGDGDDEGEPEEELLDPLFESAASSDSVTKKTAFANVEFRGDPERELIIVDTPGHDDPAGNELDSKEAREALGAIAADLHNKLKALDFVHTILVLHNDVISNRLNPATYQILKMIDEKFVKAGRSVWDHVVVGYSKCNAFETSWRSGLEGKKKALREAIQAKIPSSAGAKLPVLTLGGGEIEPPPPSHDELDGLEQLWEFLMAAEPLDTSQLQPFEGADVKWEKMVRAKDEAEAKAKAALIYVAVMIKLGFVISTLFWRHMLLPTWVSVLLLNFPGILDEVLIVAAFVYWLGPADVAYSVQHTYKTWVLPKVEPLIEAYVPALAQPKAKKE